MDCEFFRIYREYCAKVQGSNNLVFPLKFIPEIIDSDLSSPRRITKKVLFHAFLGLTLASRNGFRLAKAPWMPLGCA